MGWRAHGRGVIGAAICCGSISAVSAAGSSADTLKACLAAFDGIAWQMPYRPFTKVHRCSWAGGGYNAQPNAQQDGSSLELIASGAMPRKSSHSVSASDYQDAVFTHFDRVFTQHGFERLETRHAEQGGGRFVEFARYLKGGSSGRILTWQTGAANTWVVKLEAPAR
jgi:hypothetical protein